MSADLMPDATVVESGLNEKQVNPFTIFGKYSCKDITPNMIECTGDQ